MGAGRRQVLLLLMAASAIGVPADAQGDRAPLMVSAWTFDRDRIAGVPDGWTASGGSGERVYRIEREQDGNAFLRARSRRDGVQLGVEFQTDARNGLVLTWRWRVWELPPAPASTRLTRWTVRRPCTRSSGHGCFHVSSSTCGPAPFRRERVCVTRALGA